MTDETNDTEELIRRLRMLHRRRRFAMKLQQKIDRALESYIRINVTDWHPSDDEAEREKANKQVRDKIKAIRAGTDSIEADVVHRSDAARAPADEMRDGAEAEMERIAKNLPVYPWIESIRGAGALGLATIVAECGDLANYDNPAKIWKRLGFAPYDGFAGSSWKRDTWRPRALTKQEWIDNPFSGERYALMHQIATWLVNAQWIGKAKSDDGEGKPNGPYGTVYYRRRQHTFQSHPDWTDGHRRKDALRIAMKAFLKDLWIEWRGAERIETPVLPPAKRRSKRKLEVA